MPFPIDSYNPVLAPSDPSLASRLYAWYSCDDTACFPGGVYPSEGVAPLSWIDKSGNGRNLTRTSHGQFETVDGRRSLRIADGTVFSRSSFFGGLDWSEYTILAMVRPQSVDIGTNFMTAINGGSTVDLYFSVFRSSVTGASQVWTGVTGRHGWLPSGILNPVGSNTDVGKRVRFFVDGDFHVSPTPSTPPVGDLVLGDRTSQNTVNINELVVFRGSLGWLEAIRLGRWFLQSKSVPRRPYTLVGIGNSMTESTVGSGFLHAMRSQNFPALSGLDFEIINLAASGGGTQTLIDQSADVADVLNDIETNERRAVITMWHGHNNDAWNATIQSQIQNYLAPYRADGHKTVLIGITPAYGQASYETNRNTHIAWIAANGLTYHDAVVRPDLTNWANDANDPAGGGNNTNGYYSDGIHLSSTGNSAMGDLVYPDVESQLLALDPAEPEYVTLYLATAGGGLLLRRVV
jgi:lysophospholipase L1-like esterase